MSAINNRIKGITIEINGDTSKLGNALKDAEAKSKDLSKQLKEINASLKFNPGNAELAAQKQRVLAEQVEVTRDKLTLLKKAQEDAAEALARGDIGQAQYDALSREVLKAENQLKSFERELQVGRKSLTALGQDLQGIGKKATDVGASLTKWVTAPLVGVGAAAVKAFDELDKGFDVVVKKTGATGDAAKDLQQSFDNVFADMPNSAVEVGNAMGEINTQFGVSGKALEELTKKALEYCKVTDTDQTEAVLSAKKIMEQYGGALEDIPAIFDALARAGMDTGASVDRISELMSKHAVQLKDLGFDYSQAALLIGKVSQAGYDEGKVLQALTKAQAEFAKKGQDMGVGLKELETRIKGATTEQDKINLATEIFGSRNGPLMASVLDQGILSWDNYAAAASNAQGAVSDTYSELLDPLDKLKQLGNELLVPLGQLGAVLLDSVMPALTFTGDKIRDFAEWLQGLDPAARSAMGTIALLAAALGPLASAFGGVVTVVGKAVSALGSLSGASTAASAAAKGVAGALTTTNTAGGAFLGGATAGAVALTAGLAALGGGLYALEANFGTFSSQRQAEIDNYKASLDDASAYTYDEWTGMEGYTIDRWGNISKAITGSGDTILGVVKDRFTKAKAEATGQTDSMAAQIESKYAELQQRITEQMERLKGATVGKAGEASTGASTRIADMTRNMQAKFAEIKNSGDTNFNGLAQRIAERVESIRQRVQQGMDAVKRAVNVDLGKPRLKLPHIRVSGGFNLETGATPSFGIDWYRQGGIFKAPTIIGVGEAGSEAVLPIDRLSDILARTLRQLPSSGGTIISGNTFVVREEADVRKVAEELYRLEMQEKRARGLR